MTTTPLTPEEQELMLKNTGLVKYWAKTYMGKTQSMDFNDLVQSGYEGLIRAIRGFDESLGYTFATYAQWAINRAIIRAIRNEDKIIRIPENYYTVYNRYKKSKKNIRDFCNEEGIDELLFRRIITLMSPSLSLNYALIVDELNIDDYIALIKDEGPTPEEKVLYQELKKEMEQIFTDLINEGMKERNVLITKRYYSSDDTLEIIGQDYGLTRERVRQIIAKVLRHVKIKLQRRNLEDYLHDSYLQDFISMES